MYYSVLCSCVLICVVIGLYLVIQNCSNFLQAILVCRSQEVQANLATL